MSLDPEPVITLSEEERQFIQDHLNDSVPELLLASARYPGLDVKKLGAQILSRQKARSKLPAWYGNKYLFFAPPLSVEQGSSEATAVFKAGLVSGRKLIDVTGGMGVDCFYMSQNFEMVEYFEQQRQVAAVARHTFAVLGAGTKIRVHAQEAIAFLDRTPDAADWIYIDPARRDDQARKVAQLADCTPDVTKVLPILFKTAPAVLIKTAPLLDIDLAISQIRHVHEVHVLGAGNECKEVLYTARPIPLQGENIPIRVRILTPDGQVRSAFDFTRKEERAAVPEAIDELSTYLYEPHAAILKAGAFKVLAERLGIKKLAPNTHLYTSERYLPDFPGRGFEILGTAKPDRRSIHEYLPESKAHLTLRNFPGTVETLRKKWRLKEGGEQYLFATELGDKSKIVIVTRKPYLE